MAGVPLYAPVESRDGSLQKGAFTKNAFAEAVGDAMHTFRRPGLSPYSTSTAGAGQGITNFFGTDGEEYLIQVSGGIAYTNAPVGYDTDWVFSGNLQSASGNNLGRATWSNVVRFRGLLWVVGTQFFDTSSTRFLVAYSADDGTTWTFALDVAEGGSYPTAAKWELCSHGGKLFLVHGTEGASHLRQCWSSTDGTTWTQVSAATGVTSAYSTHLLSHSDGYMYLFLSTTTNPVWRSTDGVSWASPAATAAFNGTGQLFGYGCIAQGSYLYVFGGAGSGTNGAHKVYRSADAATWSELGTNVLSEIFSAATQPGGVECIAGFYKGLFWLYETMDGSTPTRNLWSSPDAQEWTLRVTTTAGSGAGGLWHGQTSGPVVSAMRLCWTASGIAAVGFPVATGPTGVLSGAWVLPYAAGGGAVATPIGSVGSGFVDFAQDFARTFVAVKSASSLIYIGVPTFLPTTVNDADYPTTTVRGLVYLNGTFYVMDPDGTIRGSAKEDITSWPALNYINAEFEADGGVCLVKYGLYVVAMGEFTTEYFFDAGNATGSPLSPAQNGVLGVGCADADTVVSMDDTILFVGRAKGPSQSVTGSRFVAQLDGTNYKRLSSPDIDRILMADDFADVEAVAFSVAGHSYYALNLGTSALTLVYDLSQQKWYVWTRRRTSFTNTVASVVTAGGTATWTGTHSFADGDVGIVSAFAGTHTALNGTFNVTVPASGTLCWNVGTAYSGTSSGTGTATGYSESDFGIVGACGYLGTQIAQDASNGKLYHVDPGTYQDDSVYMDWRVRLAKQDHDDSKRKFVAYADFVSDRAAGNVLMRFSDDDSQSWTKFKPKGLAGPQTRWHRGGSFRRRVYEYRITDNIPVRAQRAEWLAEEGAP